MITNSYSQLNPELTYFLVIGIILVISSFRSLKGRRVRPFRLFLRPLIYILLGAVFLVEGFSFIVVVSVISGSLVGFLLGDRFGSGAEVFVNAGEIFYRRSPIVLGIWLLSYVGRVFIYQYDGTGSSSIFLDVALDFLLFSSAFMLMGESIYVYKEYSRIKNANH